MGWLNIGLTLLSENLDNLDFCKLLQSLTRLEWSHKHVRGKAKIIQRELEGLKFPVWFSSWIISYHKKKLIFGGTPYWGIHNKARCHSIIGRHEVHVSLYNAVDLVIQCHSYRNKGMVGSSIVNKN